MSDGQATRESNSNGGTSCERAHRGATDVDPFEVMEGLQAQIDDLVRTVERHQAILERFTSSDLPPKEV